MQLSKLLVCLLFTTSVVPLASAAEKGESLNKAISGQVISLNKATSTVTIYGKDQNMPAEAMIEIYVDPKNSVITDFQEGGTRHIEELESRRLVSIYADTLSGRLVAHRIILWPIRLKSEAEIQEGLEKERIETPKHLEEIKELKEKKDIAALVERLDFWKWSNEVHSAAAKALIEIGPEVVPYLVKELRPAGAKKDWTIGVLEELGPKAEEAIPAIVDYMEQLDDSTTDLFTAAGLIGRIGGRHIKENAPRLLGLLRKSNNRFVRNYIAGTLRRLSPEDKASVPNLDRILEDERRRTDGEIIRLFPKKGSGGS